MARRKNEPLRCPDCDRALLSKKELERLSIAFHAAAERCSTASDIIDEAIAGGEGAMRALHLLRQAWRYMPSSELCRTDW